MSAGIILSRISITGTLNENTPLCVLKEIADIHGIDSIDRLEKTYLNNIHIRRDVIRELNESHYTQHEIIPPITKDVDKIAASRFVNKYTSWNMHDLREAFSILRIYMREAPLPSEHFIYGLQTPRYVASLNVCVLYKICRANNLHMEFHHSAKHLEMAVRMIIQPTHISCKFIYRQLSYVHEDNIPSLYLKVCNMMDVGNPSPSMADVDMIDYHTDITNSIELFKDHATVLRRVVPKTYGEAIALGALVFNMDVSYSYNPILEYNNMIKSHECSEDWIPIDKNMRLELRYNPMSFRLDTNFNPNLPGELYGEDNLIGLAEEEGFDNEDLNNEAPYSLLCFAFLSPTFYHGKYPTILNEKTHMHWLDVEKIPPQSFLCYGVRTQGLTALRYNELTDLFRINRNFTNPLDENGGAFPELAIKKLKRLCQSFGINDTEESMNERKALYQVIEIAELFTKTEGTKLKKFYNSYRKGTDEYKQQIRNILQSMLNLAMYMRGWFGEGDYPIGCAPVENYNEVYIQVTAGINDFENLCKELGEGEEMIMKLPLVMFKRVWIISTDDLQGRTIGDRLLILKNGDEHTNYNSCIRLTSNWFCASCFRYMQLVEMKEPFDIYKLREIS